jgi:hypothetical protein
MRSAETPSAETPSHGERRWPEGLGRLHTGEALRLHLRNLYILPTRFGGLWLAGAALLQVVGIQTQRNGPLLLSFLLLALLLLAMHLTHANLQGLELRCATPAPGFADAALAYPLLLHSDSWREGIELRLADGPPSPPLRLRAGVNPLLLEWHCRRRGFQTPGALLIRSTAPLGLFVCWSRWWLGFDQARQEELLNRLLGRQRWALGWLVLAGIAAGLASGQVLLRRGQRPGDPHERDLRGLLRLLAQLGLEAEPGETLEQLANRASAQHPLLAPPLSELVACHRQRRYALAGRQGRQRWRQGLRELKRRRRDAIRQAKGSRP